MRTRRPPSPLCTTTRRFVCVPACFAPFRAHRDVLSPDELFLELLHHYTTNDWAPPVTVAPSLRAPAPQNAPLASSRRPSRPST